MSSSCRAGRCGFSSSGRERRILSGRQSPPRMFSKLCGASGNGNAVRSGSLVGTRAGIGGGDSVSQVNSGSSGRTGLCRGGEHRGEIGEVMDGPLDEVELEFGFRRGGSGGGGSTGTDRDQLLSD